MKFRDLFAAAAALSLTATPVLAASAGVGRTVAPATEESGIEGANAIVWIVGALILGLGVYLLVDDGGSNNDNPASP
jgi:hypothetical protein